MRLFEEDSKILETYNIDKIAYKFKFLNYKGFHIILSGLYLVFFLLWLLILFFTI
jgi:hypothetical protein